MSNFREGMISSSQNNDGGNFLNLSGHPSSINHVAIAMYNPSMSITYSMFLPLCLLEMKDKQERTANYSLNPRSTSVGSRGIQVLPGSPPPHRENRDRMIATAAILSEALLLVQDLITSFHPRWMSNLVNSKFLSIQSAQKETT
jgi:hypothetical protein